MEQTRRAAAAPPASQNVIESGRERDYTPRAYSAGENVAFGVKMGAIIILIVGLLWLLNRSL